MRLEAGFWVENGASSTKGQDGEVVIARRAAGSRERSAAGRGDPQAVGFRVRAGLHALRS